jgi:hypothetical protein
MTQSGNHVEIPCSILCDTYNPSLPSVTPLNPTCEGPNTVIQKKQYLRSRTCTYAKAVPDVDTLYHTVQFRQFIHLHIAWEKNNTVSNYDFMYTVNYDIPFLTNNLIIQWKTQKRCITIKYPAKVYSTHLIGLLTTFNQSLKLPIRLSIHIISRPR